MEDIDGQLLFNYCEPRKVVKTGKSLLSQNKSMFKIGDIVLLNRIAKITYRSDNEREWQRKIERIMLDQAILGQIIGAVFRQEGIYRPSTGHSNGFGEYDDYDPASLSADKTILLWQVRLGITNKPIEVFPDDLIKSSISEYSLPWKSRLPTLRSDCLPLSCK